MNDTTKACLTIIVLLLIMTYSFLKVMKMDNELRTLVIKNSTIQPQLFEQRLRADMYYSDENNIIITPYLNNPTTLEVKPCDHMWIKEAVVVEHKKCIRCDEIKP